MTTLNRSTVLRAAGLAVIPAFPTGASATTPTVISPADRLRRAVDELKAAAEAVYSNICEWLETGDDASGGRACRFSLAAYDRQGNDGFVLPEDMEERS